MLMSVVCDSLASSVDGCPANVAAASRGSGVLGLPLKNQIYPLCNRQLTSDFEGGGVMAISLNHTIVVSRDKEKTAIFLTEILGLPPHINLG
jgi:hypothetical protein